jgi:hypothetical protein
MIALADSYIFLCMDAVYNICIWEKFIAGKPIQKLRCSSGEFVATGTGSIQDETHTNHMGHEASVPYEPLYLVETFWACLPGYHVWDPRQL